MFTFVESNTMKIRLIICFLLLGTNIQAQFKKEKGNRFPIGSYHFKNTKIHGVSLGLGTSPNNIRNVTTNGVKLELIGVGLFVALIPESPISDTKQDFDTLYLQKRSELINGLSLSLSGTACNCVTNGVSLSGWAHYNYQVNGISGVWWINFTEIVNGLQFSFILNDSYLTRGVQVGLINRSQSLTGVQFGLWNINQKRKFPIINWNFKKNEF